MNLLSHSCKSVSATNSMHDEIPDSYLWSEEDRPIEQPGDCGENGTVPVIDLQLEQNNQEAQIIHQIGRACEKGYFLVVNHGISQKLLDGMENYGRQLFSLPLEQKLKAERNPDGTSGYGVARIASFFNKSMWSEGFTWVRSPEEDAKTLWPQDYRKFCELKEDYERALKKLAIKLMSLIGRTLGLNTGDSKWCDIEWDATAGALQMNYYPPCPQPFRTMGMAPHTDSTLLTLLYQGQVEGLHFQLQDGRWIIVPGIANSLIVNMGDLLQVLSNGRCRSVVHRAVPNSRTSRLSIAYLWGPSSMAVIRPAPELIDTEHPLLYRPLTWNECLTAKRKHLYGALELFKVDNRSVLPSNSEADDL
eukprot:PITA_10360